MCSALDHHFVPALPSVLSNPQATCCHVVQPTLLACCPYALLQEVFQEAKQRLPRSSYLYLCRTITRSIGSAIIRLFTPEGAVKAYNLCAIQRLASDVAELQDVTAECGVPDLALEFAASAQLCSLLLSHKVQWIGCLGMWLPWLLGAHSRCF